MASSHETVAEVGPAYIRRQVVEPGQVSTEIVLAPELERIQQVAAEQGQESTASWPG